MDRPEQQQLPPPGYPTENPPTGKKKKWFSRSKPKGDRGFIEGWKRNFQKGISGHFLVVSVGEWNLIKNNGGVVLLTADAAYLHCVAAGSAKCAVINLLYFGLD
ncbi:hypothetical protein M9H77_03971 [Catharanthus roseus]|uniref:Uncharacterized protein n=1 Tax=Catharanthus roseus TaxID=4058 RepID=A0ACC0CD60_CATRO|nr:hypothetical protein M9H77_03971 [Catharanthus roseus]